MKRPEDPKAHDAPPRPAPLLVADHLALDFVNSRAAGSEWLADGAGLIASTSLPTCLRFVVSRQR